MRREKREFLHSDILLCQMLPFKDSGDIFPVSVTSTSFLEMTLTKENQENMEKIKVIHNNELNLCPSDK